MNNYHFKKITKKIKGEIFGYKYVTIIKIKKLYQWCNIANENLNIKL